MALYSTSDGQVGSQVAMGVTCVSRDWDQKTVTWNRASSTVNWTSPGVDNLSSPVTKSSRANQFINQWETITVTDHVKKWVADRPSNFGFKLALDDGGVEWIDWASSEYATIANRPKLTINYTSNTGPVGVRRTVQALPKNLPDAIRANTFSVDGRKMLQEHVSGVRIIQTRTGLQTIRTDIGH